MPPKVSSNGVPKHAGKSNPKSIQNGTIQSPQRGPQMYQIPPKIHPWLPHVPQSDPKVPPKWPSSSQNSEKQIKRLQKTPNMCQIDGKTQPWVQSWPPGPRPQKPKPSSPQVIKGRGRRQGLSLQIILTFVDPSRSES